MLVTSKGCSLDVKDDMMNMTACYEYVELRGHGKDMMIQG